MSRPPLPRNRRVAPRPAPSSEPLDATPPPASVSTDEPVRVEEPGAAPASARAMRRLAIGGWGLALALAGALWWWPRGPADERGAGASSAAVSAPAAVVSAPAAVVSPCPAGMVTRGRLGAIRLEQPARPAWPRARSRELPAVEVGLLCIDPAPVSARHYLDCIERGSCARLPEPRPAQGCNWGSSPSPINCVTVGEARAYCQQRGADLPTVVQWEAASQRLRGLLDFPTNTGDWARDAFPAAVWQREAAQETAPQHAVFAQRLSTSDEGWSAPRTLDFGWNRAFDDARRADLTFRCAIELP